MKKLLIILTLICFNTSAKDNVMELPFNLKFGMTLNDLEKLGIQVRLEKKNGNVETYNLNNSHNEWVNKSLIFFQHRLNGIELTSNIYNDGNGKDVINAYKKYHEILSNKCDEIDYEVINGINAVNYLIPNNEFYLKENYKNFKGLFSVFKNCSENTEYQIGIYRTPNGGQVYLASYTAKPYISN